MAKPPTPPASLPKQLANFTNTTAGMDMTLRLLQALAMIATVVCQDKPTVVMSSIAASQLALGKLDLTNSDVTRLTSPGRRYLRFLSSYGCFQRVYDLLSGESAFAGSILTMSYLAEYTFLGIYLLMEDTTIVFLLQLLTSRLLTGAATRHEHLACGLVHPRSIRSEQVLVLRDLHLHSEISLGTYLWLPCEDDDPKRRRDCRREERHGRTTHRSRLDGTPS